MMHEDHKEDNHTKKKKNHQDFYKNLSEDKLENLSKTKNFKRKKQKIRDEESWENWKEFYR